jgi:MFS family permease
MTRVATPPRLQDKRRSVPRPFAFWLVGAAIATVTAASSAPSPLYPLYQARFRFSEITLTVIFAIYAFSLLISLLTIGRLSDYIGRRVVLAGALAVDAVAMALFVGANDVGWLLWARAVQGFATGAAFGVAGAYLFDLQPVGSRLGSLVNTALPVLGIGLGAIIAGVLVQYGPHPRLLIFEILMALFVLLTFATALLPETVRRVPGAAVALRPRVAVPPRARRAFAGAVPTMVSGWALNGLTLSVGASLLGAVFRQSNHGVIGLVIGLFTLSAAAASVLERDMSPWTMARLGSVAIAVGAILFVFALVWTSIALFVLASIVGGGGFGSGYLGSIRSVSQLAELHERAGLISAVYVVSYLAFSIPALVAGVLATHIGLRATSFAYGAFVAIVAVGASAFGGVNVRRERGIAG